MSVVESPSSALPKPRRLGLVLIPMALASVAWGGAALVHKQVQTGATQFETMTVQESHGATLYAQHCANCHGPSGQGPGLAYLEPRARQFGKDKFKFASTTNGIPSDEDLLRLLTRGIPGSAMPAFDHLNEAELRAIIEQVRLFTRQGVFAELKKQAENSEEDVFDPVKTTKKVAELTAVGTPHIPPTFGPVTSDSIARGRSLFLGKETACASCHGEQGKGDGPQGVARLELIRAKVAKKEPLGPDEKDLLRDSESGTLVFPRNLTSGIYKGGRDPAHISARISLGIPGVIAMPAVKLPPDDLRDLVNYVMSLSNGPVEVPRVSTTVVGQ